LEVFWGQLNEEVRIVPPDKYHACAKEAMSREVFSEEFADTESLKDEFIARISKTTLVELNGKIQANPTDSNLKTN